MATDPDRRPTNHPLVLLALLAVTAYVAWRVTPLGGRMQAIERDHLAARDQLLMRIERLEAQIAAERAGYSSIPPSAPSQGTAARSGNRASLASTPPPAPASPSASPVRTDPVAAESFFAHRLLPEQSAIASMLVQGIPPLEIARRLRHSVKFIIATGIQAEKELAAAPDTPPDILAALRAAVERARSADR